MLAELATLSALVARRPGSEDSIKVMLKAYAGKLDSYPGDMVIASLRDWPEHSQWWPTWFELRDLLEKRVEFRRRLKADLDRIAADARQIEATFEKQETPEERADVVRAARAKLTESAELAAKEAQRDHRPPHESLRERFAFRGKK